MHSKFDIFEVISAIKAIKIMILIIILYLNESILQLNGSGSKCSSYGPKSEQQQWTEEIRRQESCSHVCGCVGCMKYQCAGNTRQRKQTTTTLHQSPGAAALQTRSRESYLSSILHGVEEEEQSTINFCPEK